MHCGCGRDRYLVGGLRGATVYSRTNDGRPSELWISEIECSRKMVGCLNPCLRIRSSGFLKEPGVRLVGYVEIGYSGWTLNRWGWDFSTSLPVHITEFVGPVGFGPHAVPVLGSANT
jgi:hypothetical protein